MGARGCAWEAAGCGRGAAARRARRTQEEATLLRGPGSAGFAAWLRSRLRTQPGSRRPGRSRLAEFPRGVCTGQARPLGGFPLSSAGSQPRAALRKALRPGTQTLLSSQGDVTEPSKHLTRPALLRTQEVCVSEARMRSSFLQPYRARAWLVK